ncbi:MAG: DUF4062 domain-containing protein [Deltaproteobacteria bacterium]|nr:DUF4062 domain-containing protein [Deltaproteobacteria bacterium]
MPRPRIFVSSTFYDLKHIRSSLESFIEGMGYEPVLSEKGKIAYDPDIPLDESCYREATTVDILVLIVGGRYGSASSDVDLEGIPEFYDRYESITKKEYNAAYSKDIPIYVLVEKNVLTEYETYKKNKGNKTIQYAHVDSVNVFLLLEEIIAMSKNNPIHQFEKHSEIQYWLKEQLAGLFHELINRRSEQKQLSTLSDKVTELASINSSLQRYMEAVVSRVSATEEEANELIQSEKERLDAEKTIREFSKIGLVSELIEMQNVTVEELVKMYKEASSIDDIAAGAAKILGEDGPDRLIKYWKDEYPKAIERINLARSILGENPLKFEEKAKKTKKFKSK